MDTRTLDLELLHNNVLDVIADEKLLERYPPAMSIIVAIKTLNPELTLKEARAVACDNGLLEEKARGEFTLTAAGRNIVEACGGAVGAPAVKIVNLTPHEVTVKTDGGEIVIPPSGQVARCAEKRSPAPALETEMGSIPVSRASYGAVEGLPDPQPGVVYIVSALVLAAVPERRDVFAPGPAIRDEEGRIIGCDGLSCSPAYLESAPDYKGA